MISSRALVTLLAIAVAVGVAFPVAAQEKSWVGESVLNVKPPQEIRFGDRVGGKEVSYPFSGTWPFHVREEREGWLRVHDRRREGWVSKSDFVLANDAIPYFTGRIEGNARDVFAFQMRGAAWLQKREYDKAIADFNACLAISPNVPTAYNDRGLAWEGKKEYDKSIADFSEAIRINSQIPLYFANRARLHRIVKEYDKGIADCTETIRLEPRYALAFYERGICRVLKKEYDRALEDYDESIRLDPKSSQTFRERGVCHAWKKNNDLAIKDYDESIRLDPKATAAYRLRGQAWRSKKDFAKALADYEQAVRVDPKNAQALADHAWVLATCADATFRNGDKAVTLAKSACELSQYKIPAQISVLAAAYAESGDFKQAIHWMNKALEFPDFAKTLGERGPQRLRLYESRMPYRETSALHVERGPVYVGFARDVCCPSCSASPMRIPSGPRT